MPAMTVVADGQVRDPEGGVFLRFLVNTEAAQTLL